MLVDSVNDKNIKILFDTNKEQLLLSDLVKIINKKNIGVLAQVSKIEDSRQNPGHNIADAEILFTIAQSDKCINWKGNVPSREYNVQKIKDQEFLSYSNWVNQSNQVSLGKLSLYPNTKANIEAAYLESPTVIFCDDQLQKANILYLLAQELTKNNAKTVILDFKGEYSYMPLPGRIEAGKDLKLPLNSWGIENLYDDLLNISPETRALIEDVFMQVQDYADSSEFGFVPFSSFKDVVDAEYEESNITELVLLKNKLIKLEKQGIYANDKSEVDALKTFLDNENFIILDFSAIPDCWHEKFVDFIVNTSIKDSEHKFFIIFETEKTGIKPDLIDKLYIQGYRSGIKPIICTRYESKFVEKLMNPAQNLIFYPSKSEHKLSDFSNYIDRLNQNEILIYGKISNYIPVVIKLDQIINEEEFRGNNRIFDIDVSSSNFDINIDIEPDNEEEDVSVDDNDDEINELQEIQKIVSQEFNESLYELAQEYQAKEGLSQEKIDPIELQNDDNNINDDTDDEFYYNDYLNNNDNNSNDNNINDDIEELYTAKKASDIPIYSTASDTDTDMEFDLKEGDKVRHHKYDIGVIKKIISYGSKKLCYIQFKDKRRILDVQLAALEKVSEIE
ncbi:MAG: DUF87 domain-containing protein [bacterium]